MINKDKLFFSIYVNVLVNCTKGICNIGIGSHTVIVSFGCGQYKQPGEGWAPSG